MGMRNPFKAVAASWKAMTQEEQQFLIENGRDICAANLALNEMKEYSFSEWKRLWTRADSWNALEGNPIGETVAEALYERATWLLEGGNAR